MFFLKVFKLQAGKFSSFWTIFWLISHILDLIFLFNIPDSSAFGPFCAQHTPYEHYALRWDTDYLAQDVFEREINVHSGNTAGLGFVYWW